MSEKIYGQFDLETIRALADIVKERDLDEITIKEDSITIKAKRCPPPPPVNMSPAMGGMPFPMPRDPMPMSPNAAAPNVSPAVEAQTAYTGNIVKSPIVGTFYAAPGPDKPSFVSVGSRVRKGDVLMIIESMKLMNEIQSEFDGVVSKILVRDGEPVEYDQPVMVIDSEK